MARGVGTLLPSNQRQHRTLHIQKDVLPYALCYLVLDTLRQATVNTTA